MSLRNWCTKIEKRKELCESLPAIAKIHTVSQPISFNKTFDHHHHSDLSTNHCISDSFQSIQILRQRALLQWSIGQDLPAIEGHGGLRPGKCQIYQEFENVKEWSDAKVSQHNIIVQPFCEGQTFEFDI